MIKLGKTDYKQVLTNEELEFLARSYLKLQKDDEYLHLKKTFEKFIDEYLKKELLDANDILHKEDRRKK